MEEVKKQILYSAIQPTNCLTLGNYVGAMRNWIKLQNDYDCIFAAADLHSLTVRQDPAALRKNILSLFAQFLAAGIDPEKSIVYLQSSVHEHAELAWILNTFSPLGELERMTQFKDKSAKHEDNINVGLLDYPVLMAADILLYKSALVPVGADQKQHLEFARNVAVRFNNIYGDTFVVPEPYIAYTAGAKICSLQEPTKKMSKSDTNENATVSIIDAPDVIMRKFKRAVTDSDAKVVFDSENKPGVSNLLTIYSCFADVSVKEAEARFEGKGYGDFKTQVAQVVIEKLKPLQAEYEKLMQNKDYLLDLARKGAEKASYLASRTLSKVYKKVGLLK